MIRKSVLQKYNLKYNTEFAGAEDYCLWWNIAKVMEPEETIWSSRCFYLYGIELSIKIVVEIIILKRAVS